MWRKAKWIALACTAVILCVVGYYGYSFYQFGTNIQEKKDDPFLGQFKTQNMSATEEAPPKWEGKERVNILLLGADSRGTSKNEVPRSDTIMVASIDPLTKKAHLFSILRDTYVKIPGHGEDRVNAAFSLGGPNLAMRTVGELLGISIQYYVYTDFQGFMALVDAIGGIDIDVEKDMKYRDSEEPEFDINLKKGFQHMDGKTALQYVRFRHDATSDFTRTERQRKFMTAVADKMQTTSSILRLPSILNKIDPYITTNMSITDMIKLGSLGFEVKAQGVTGVQIPPSSLLQDSNVGGASVLTVNKAKLLQYVKEQLNGESNPSGLEYADDKDDGRTSGSAIKSGTSTGTSGSSSSGVKSGTGGSSSGTGGTKATTGTSGTGTVKPSGSSGTTGTKTTGGTGTGGATSGGTKSTTPATSGSGTAKPPASGGTAGSGTTKPGTGTATTPTGDKATSGTAGTGATGGAGSGGTATGGAAGSGGGTATPPAAGTGAGAGTSATGDGGGTATGGSGTGGATGGAATSGSTTGGKPAASTVPPTGAKTY
ncbi:hypothetical protein DLM86_28100 [Paenibacillus flagellatus]|uniref:Cell envelope-related transcriptional attenuator domain-containing protein n=1 Tax=Paenibacillus flagellatus TaxID=2211139 RepID=A0A2V5KJM7_9BACL|nr:hypothetical protein DLM86_28100 [Paenibacillus flagellatus]